MRAFNRRLAGLFPLRMSACNCSRSSALSRTTYFFTAMSFPAMLASVARISDRSESSNPFKLVEAGDYKECVIPAFPGDPKTAPPSYRYFIAMVERLHNVRPEDLTENSVLLGSTGHIGDVLKKVTDAGFDEVILTFDPFAVVRMNVRGRG